MMKPNINVTPLIDVLLVLLIIFMVVAPAKPSRFETQIPSDSKPDPGFRQHPNSLIVHISPDGRLLLNLDDAGSVADTSLLAQKLESIFRDRAKDGILRTGTSEVERTVFVSAPRSLLYGQVVAVIDSVASAGAEPVGLLPEANGTN